MTILVQYLAIFSLRFLMYLRPHSTWRGPFCKKIPSYAPEPIGCDIELINISTLLFIIRINRQQYPFYVRVEITTNESAPISVAGALLNASFALTTARHLRRSLLQFSRNNLNVRVVAGERSDLWDLCNQSRQQSQVRKVKALVVTHSY